MKKTWKMLIFDVFFIFVCGRTEFYELTAELSSPIPSWMILTATSKSSSSEKNIYFIQRYLSEFLVIMGIGIKILLPYLPAFSFFFAWISTSINWECMSVPIAHVMLLHKYRWTFHIKDTNNQAICHLWLMSIITKKFALIFIIGTRKYSKHMIDCYMSVSYLKFRFGREYLSIWHHCFSGIQESKYQYFTVDLLIIIQ